MAVSLHHTASFTGYQLLNIQRRKEAFKNITMDITIKERLHEACLHKVEQRISDAKASMEAVQEAANEETKSSAGDKYETGRAMMQQEQDKAASQLMEALKLKKVLDQLNAGKEYQQVQAGSLIFTDQGNFYISASIGQLSLEGVTYMVISPVSPLAQQMAGLQAGEELNFNGRKFKVQQVV